MARLIDAEALKERLKEHCVDGDSEATEWYSMMGIDEEIDDAPTVDAVEVVRCKDCLNSWVMPKEMRNVGEYRCEFWYAEMYCDDYCSYGERREDE